MTKNSQLTEGEKNQYINEFFDGIEMLMEKKRFSKKSRGTSVKSRNIISTWPNGKKKEITLTNGRAKIVYTIEVRPWLWSDKTVFVEVEFKDAKKLNIPKNLIKPKIQGSIWKYNYDPIFFLTNTNSVVNYIQAVELTPMDVSLFDSIKVAAENIFK